MLWWQWKQHYISGSRLCQFMSTSAVVGFGLFYTDFFPSGKSSSNNHGCPLYLVWKVRVKVVTLIGDIDGFFSLCTWFPLSWLPCSNLNISNPCLIPSFSTALPQMHFPTSPLINPSTLYPSTTSHEPASDALSIYPVYRTHSSHSGHNADADNGSLLARENASSNDVPDLPFFWGLSCRGGTRGDHWQCLG